MLTWREQSRDFIRSDCGRFDAVWSPERGAWVVIDWDRGVKFTDPSLDEVKVWCAGQAIGNTSAKEAA